MRGALAVAARGLGRVSPSPAVGCVLVAGEGDAARIVGRGWTGRGGAPHAETEALSRARAAGEDPRGATIYVTLEPCAHHGKTPPCANALIESGIARVVGAMEDPDPRVQGRGFARLREAGIGVEIGLLAEEAARLNAGFLTRLRHSRPLITLKMATGLDGRIAPREGERAKMSGEDSHRWAHRLRSDHDAILVGARTALIDDPDLTSRLAGLEDDSPLRLVADSRLSLPLTSALVRSAKDGPPLCLLCLPEADRARRAALRDCGVRILDIPPDKKGVMDMRAAAKALAAEGITRLLLEGGGRLAASFLSADLVDRLVWFHGAAITGGDGVSSVAFLEESVPRSRLRVVSRLAVGEDVMLEADIVKEASQAG